jgi:C-terminal processing protease CtpA/Prc
VFKKKDTGWRLEIPVVDFRTISGERIEGKGLAPDIEVRLGGAADAVVEEALRYLKDASAKRR